MDESDPPEVSSDLVSLTIRRESKLFCDACLEDGSYLEAEGYCVDCAEHLCDRCFKHHCIPRAFRSHQLLDGQVMPKTKQDACKDKCTIHTDKIVESYCEDHQTGGCTVCMTLGHRTCNVGKIQTLSADLFNSEGYITLKRTMEYLIKETISIRDKTKTNLKTIKVQAERTMAEIRTLRKQVDDFFNDLEQKVTTEVAKVQIEDQNSTEATEKQNDVVSKELQKMQREIVDKESKNQKCRLFVDMKDLKEKISKIKSDISTLKSGNHLRDLTFVSSTHVTDFIKNKSQILGSLFISHKTVPVTSATDINPVCNITDIAVLPAGRMAVYDSFNGAVKIVDTNNGTQIRTKSAPTYPSCGITSVSDNTIALLQDDTIEIYSVTDKLKLEKTIRSTGLFRSIVYTNNMFIGITSTSPQVLRIVNMNGTTIKTCHPSKNLFVKPWFIAMNSHLKLIYVSDWGNNTVTCLTLEGDMRAQCQYKGGWKPRGIAVSRDGVVYVCDNGNGNIHMLTSDLKEKCVISGGKHAIHKPLGLVYCDEGRQLFVGMEGSKSVRVFDISF